MVFFQLIFIICSMCGMVCILAALFFQFRAAALRKPEIPWQLSISLLNVLFEPSVYTDAGVGAARRCRQCLVGFTVFLILALLIGLSTGMAH